MASPITRPSRDSNYLCLDMDLPEPMDDQTPIYGLWKDGVTVNIFLISGIKLVGVIDWFDGEVITLRSAGDQCVFRQAIASIIPAAGTFFKK